MSIQIEFKVYAFGNRNHAIPFGGIHLSSRGCIHHYEISLKTEEGWRTLEGDIAKQQPDGSRRNGHRNILHLLKDVLNDVDPDALGEDYVHILKEVREECGEKARAYDYRHEG